MELLGGGNIAISSLGLYSFPQLAASEAGISNAYDPLGREIARNFSSLFLFHVSLSIQISTGCREVACG